MTKSSVYVASIILLLVVAPLSAQQIIASTSQTSVKGRCQTEQLSLVGEAKFTFLFWDVYQSKLLTNSGKYTPKEQSIYFELTYLRDISRDELIESTEQQWRHLAIAPENYRDYLPELRSLWPNVSAGDSIAIMIENGHHYFCYNQDFLGSVSDKIFSDIFLDIWLSPKTSQPQLRQQLLGLENE